MHTSLTPQREKYFLLTLAGIQFSHILGFMIMMPLGPILMAEFGVSEEQQVAKELMQGRTNGIPKVLARCIAWHITKGRDL